MIDSAPCYAEQDPTVAKVAETALRMMAGSVAPATRKRIKELASASPESYPWSEVVTAVLADPVDPSALVQKGLAAQRDWVAKAAPGTAVGPAPRSKPALGYRLKRFLAVNLARLIFHALFAVTLIVLLILIRKTAPSLDIYALADRIVAFVGSWGR